MSQDKKNTLWNMVAAMINALESVIILMVVSRVATLEIAGVVTIGFSLANLFLTVGKFGTRNYQIVHEGQDIAAQEFVKARIVTTIGMIFCVLIYSGIQLATHQYSMEKAVIIVGVCIWYIIEAFEDVYLSSLQSRGRLDVGNQMFILRWFGIYVSFIGVIMIGRNTILAILVSDVVALIIEIVVLKVVNTKYPYKRWQSSLDFKGVLKENVVLCLAGFFYFFITNIPKYAIDARLTDDIQAIYGYIAMPVFVIALLNNMIYQPQLTHYVKELRERQWDRYLHRVKRQMLIILGIMIVCCAGAFLLGIPVLSLIYHTDLTPYKNFMMLSLVGSAFLAVGGYLSTLFVIMDERNKNMIIYAITLAIGIWITFYLTTTRGMAGAVYGYLITMIIMAALFVVVFLGILRKRRNV